MGARLGGIDEANATDRVCECGRADGPDVWLGSHRVEADCGKITGARLGLPRREEALDHGRWRRHWPAKAAEPRTSQREMDGSRRHVGA